MDEYSLHFPLALVGVIFILVGIIMLLFPPKKINFLYGYRTNLSMKTQENWDYSQKYSAKLIMVLGGFLILLFLLQTNLLIFYQNKNM